MIYEIITIYLFLIRFVYIYNSIRNKFYI